MDIAASFISLGGVTFSASRKLAPAEFMHLASGSPSYPDSSESAATTGGGGGLTVLRQQSGKFLRELSGGSYTAVVTVDVAIPTSLFPAATSPSAIYSSVTSSLASAVTSGRFTTALTNAAATANDASLSGVAVTAVSSSPLVVLAPPSFMPTSSPNQGLGHLTSHSFPTKDIVIIVVVVGFSLIMGLTLFIIYCWKKKKSASTDQQQPYTLVSGDTIGDNISPPVGGDNGPHPSLALAPPLDLDTPNSSLEPSTVAPGSDAGEQATAVVILFDRRSEPAESGDSTLSDSPVHSLDNPVQDAYLEYISSAYPGFVRSEPQGESIYAAISASSVAETESI